MNKWSSAKLGNVARFKAGTGFPKELQGLKTGDFPFAKVSDMNRAGNEMMLSFAENYVTSQTVKKLKAYIHKPGAVAFAKIGIALTTNRRRQINQPTVLDNNMMSAEPDLEVIDPKFAYYLLLILDFNLVSSGSALPYLTVASLKDISIELPEISEQRQIAAILSALDDKIELNRQAAATLEEMARTLYRSWFVDFDPVRARAEGRVPVYMDAATAAVFPDSFRTDGLPVGWKIGTLNEYAMLNPTAHSNQRHPKLIKYVDLANAKWGYIGATVQYRWDAAPSRARMQLNPGDTIVGTVRPGNGSYAYVGQDGLTGSTGFAVLRPKEPMDCAFVYTASTDPETINDLANLADGAAYPAVRPDVVAARPVCVMPRDISSAFAKIVVPFINRIEVIKLESNTLVGLRDMLPPVFCPASFGSERHVRWLTRSLDGSGRLLH